MNAYEFNMMSLKRRYPGLAKQMDELKDDGTVQVVATRKPNHPTAIVDAREAKWLIHSKEDPVKEAYNFIDTVLRTRVDYANIVMVLGLGMGYHLEPLFQRYSTEHTIFIGVENNVQLFKKFIQNNRPMVNAGGHIMPMFDYPAFQLMVGVPLDQVYNYLFEFFMQQGRNSHSSFLLIEHPVLIRFNKEYYKPLGEHIQRVCYDIRSSYGNDPEDSWTGIDHMLQNLDTIIDNPGINQIEKKFKDVPAVIVATGPSLNKNIDLLPEIKDKCVFFAADASLNTFLLHDPPIIPDIVCSLERNLSTKKHFEQILDKALMNDIWLCACPVVKPEVYNAWQGKEVNMYRDFAHFTWLGVDKGKLNTGKSVTNMAFQVALYLGCNPIVLVGQDLAFAPDGQTHVKGADHAKQGLKESNLIEQKRKVMGNNGQMIDSLDTWVGMLKRFEYDIVRPECQGVKVINATEGGARIAGTECMTLREVIDKYCTKNLRITQQINDLLQYPADEDRVKDRETVSTNIENGIKYLERGLVSINEALDTLEDACGKIYKMDAKETDLVLQYCNKVRQEILTDKFCFLTAMHVIQSWCMGRENIFFCLPQFFQGKELQAERFIKMFEFFYGLGKLYKMMIEGVQRNYDKWKGVQGVSDTPNAGELQPIEREEEGLHLQGVQQEAGSGNQIESLAGRCDEGEIFS